LRRPDTANELRVVSLRHRRDLTLAQGNALRLYCQMNESPERAGQPVLQPRVGIGTPFQGFLEWGRVSQGVALGWSWNAPSGLAELV